MKRCASSKSGKTALERDRNMSNELKKQDAIEPEIINERGENLTRPPGRQSAGGVLGGLLAVSMLLVFAVIAVIIAMPMLILSLFGRKPNIRIFKFKL